MKKILSQFRPWKTPFASSLNRLEEEQRAVRERREVSAPDNLREHARADDGEASATLDTPV